MSTYLTYLKTDKKQEIIRKSKKICSSDLEISPMGLPSETKS